MSQSPTPTPSTRRTRAQMGAEARNPDGLGPDLAETPGWAQVPPVTTAPSPSPSPDPESPIGDQGSDAAPGSPAGRTPASSPSSIERLTRAGLTEAAESGFRGLGDALNGATAMDDEDEVWEVRDAEAKNFSKAAGRMLARRMPDALGENAADASDLIAVAVSAGVWLIRNLAEWLPRGRGNLFPRAKGRHRVVQGDVVDPDASV